MSRQTRLGMNMTYPRPRDVPHPTQLHKWSAANAALRGAIHRRMRCSDCGVGESGTPPQYNVVFIEGFAGAANGQGAYLVHGLGSLVANYIIVSCGTDTRYGGLCPIDPDLEGQSLVDISVAYVSKILRLAIQDIEKFINLDPSVPLLFCSHSLGYVFLTEACKQSAKIRSALANNMSRLVIIDPGGEALSVIPLIRDAVTFGQFLREFSPWNGSVPGSTARAEWNQYVDDSIPGLFTSDEMQTNTFQRVRNTYLYGDVYTLSMIAYAVDFWCVQSLYTSLLNFYGDKVLLIWPIEGISPHNTPQAPTTNIYRPEDCGHYALLFKQEECTTAIVEHLGPEPQAYWNNEKDSIPWWHPDKYNPVVNALPPLPIVYTYENVYDCATAAEHGAEEPECDQCSC